MRYVVRRGDTLRKIANRLGIGVTVLLGANPALERRGYLIPGQVLTVPETATKYEV
ncbi:LysM domain-containing protein [Aneurinibacillus thermoaerophilus]